MPKVSCKYGIKCYRKNAEHLQQFHHGSGSENDSPAKQDIDPIRSPKEQKTELQKPKITDFFQSKTIAGSSRKRKAATPEKVNYGKQPAKMKHSDAFEKDIPSSLKSLLFEKFDLNISDDFYSFWQYCSFKNSEDPRNALNETFGLSLVGPFDLIGASSVPDTLRLHWRYYFDPPEMVTVLAELVKVEKAGRKPCSTGFHIGYFRDDLSERPVACVWNRAAEDGTLRIKGDNLFATLRLYGQELIRLNKGNYSKIRQLKSEISDLEEFLSSHDLSYSLEATSKGIKRRERKIVTRTFHYAGLVVPVVNDVGYRPLPESVSNLKKMLKKIVDAKSQTDKLKAFEPLQEVVTLCQFANDEGDFGEGIELGLDLFSYGSEIFHPMILNLLPVGYQLSGRTEFAEVIELHIANRKKLDDSIDLLA